MKNNYNKYAIASKKDDNITLNAHYDYCKREKIPYVGIRFHGKYARISTDYYLETEENRIFKELLNDNGFTHKLLMDLGIARKSNKKSFEIWNIIQWYNIDVYREHAEIIAENIFDRFFECMQYAREEVKKRK